MDLWCALSGRVLGIQPQIGVERGLQTMESKENYSDKRADAQKQRGTRMETKDLYRGLFGLSKGPGVNGLV